MSARKLPTAPTLSYLITVSRAHFLSAQMLLLTLREKTNAEIVVVGNLDHEHADLLETLGARYIDEDSIDYTDRLPVVTWKEKHREFGWYKQQFIRLCIDRFMATDQVVILDSEVFVLDNWDESRLYDAETGNPRYGYWIPSERKPDWDYKMYEGAAYLLSFLPECKGIINYARSDELKRSITGVGLFSTKNIKKMWQLLEKKTDLATNLDKLFNDEPELLFSEYVMYSLAIEYGLFDDTVPTLLDEGLLGWYDNHDDPVFNQFKASAMWSMCQSYSAYNTPTEYYNYMKKSAASLKNSLPDYPLYWNEPDIALIDQKYDARTDVTYFEKYKRQLNHTFRSRYVTMYAALQQLAGSGNKEPTIVEVGTLRDANTGGGHSTYKFGEFCSRFGGTVHTVDILDEAIRFSKKATKQYQPWIKYHTTDSTKFLQEFEGQIDLLYLDGFDSTPGMEKEASKKQLDEIEAALPKMADSCIVLLDDADLPEGGKVSLSSKFLIENGFKLEISAYQQLYSRRMTEPKAARRSGRSRVKSVTKRVARRMVPRIVTEMARLRHIESQLGAVSQLTQDIDHKVSQHDTRLDELKSLAAKVEPYQPTYAVSGILEQAPSRGSLDRCRVIEDSLGDVSNMRVLDIGASLGYVCYYFADRGAITEGWEYNPDNAEVARMVGEINGITTTLKTKTFDENTVSAIKKGEHDVAIILSVLHHTIYYNGLEYTQDLMKRLLNKVPVVIVELAKKGEDTSLFWDAKLPEDELEIFKLVHNDVKITKIGEFSNHLSENSRPMYRVELKDKTVKVNHNAYVYDTKVNVAYKNSIVSKESRRVYYFSDEFFIKEYAFSKNDQKENQKQIISEIDTLLHLKPVHNGPTLVDFEISNSAAKIVLKKVTGDLLFDIIKGEGKVDPLIVARDLIVTLDELQAQEFYHNDVRSWNVLYDGKKASLIDYGLTSQKDTDNDKLALLHVISAVLTGGPEGSKTAKASPPQRKSFEAHTKLLKLYDAITDPKADTSYKALLNIL